MGTREPPRPSQILMLPEVCPVAKIPCTRLLLGVTQAPTPTWSALRTPCCHSGRTAMTRMVPGQQAGL